MVEKIVDKLLSSTPLLVILLGVFLIVSSALGFIPFAKQKLPIVDDNGRIALGISGILLCIAGVILLAREAPLSGLKKTRRKKRLSYRSFPVDPRLNGLEPPLEPGKFKIVTLPARSGPSVYNFRYTPLGQVIIDGTPFFLEPEFRQDLTLIGHKVIDIHPHFGNKPNIEEIPIKVESVSRIHFLISAGHGRAVHQGIEFLHKQIGFIEVEFMNGDPQRELLILGKNIREWAFGNPGNLVREVDYSLTQPVWVSHDYNCRIDKFSIEIVHGPRDLKSIRITAKFEPDPYKEITFPSIILSALTCER